MRAVLLAPSFSFGQNSAQSGERAARCDRPVFAAPCGKKSSLQVASAACIFVHYMLSRRRSDEKGTGGKRSCTVAYSGTGWVADLKCQEFSGKHKNLLTGTSRF